MAEIRKLTTVIAAKDMYSKALTGAQKMFKKFGAGIGTAIKAGVVVATAAFAALTAATWKAIEAAGVQEDAEARLKQALGFTSEALLEQASALQQVSKYGDETIIKAQSMLAAFIKDEDQIKKATKATLDFAAAKGISLVTAADLLAKTLGSSTNALTRYGITVTGAVGSTERLDSATEGIARLFGGQAKAQADIFTGGLKQLQNSIGDMWEKLGFAITRNETYNKIIKEAVRMAHSWNIWLEENETHLENIATRGLVWIVQGLQGGVEALKVFSNAWGVMKLAAVGTIEVLKAPGEMLGHVLGYRADFYGVSAQVISDTKKINDQMDKWIKNLDGVAERMKAVGETPPPDLKLGARRDVMADDPFIEYLRKRQEIVEFHQSQETETMRFGNLERQQEQEIAAEKALKTLEESKARETATERIAAFESNQIIQAKQNIHASANQAMENQILSLIETGKFSIGEFAKVVTQTVKMELIGISARAAVWALFETAMGFATMFTMPAASAAHFTAAGSFAAISGATAAGAAAVNAITGVSKGGPREHLDAQRQREREEWERNRPRTIQEIRGGIEKGDRDSLIKNLIQEGRTDEEIREIITPSTPIIIPTSTEPRQKITINIYPEGIISPDTMGEMVENHIMPAMNKLGREQDIKLDVNLIPG